MARGLRVSRRYLDRRGSQRTFRMTFAEFECTGLGVVPLIGIRQFDAGCIRYDESVTCVADTYASGTLFRSFQRLAKHDRHRLTLVDDVGGLHRHEAGS